MAPDVKLLGGGVAALLLIAWALQPGPAGYQGPTRTSLPMVSPSSTSPGTASDLDALLPIDRGGLTAAIRHTTHTATTYLSYRYDEPPAAYLARLRPLVTNDLYAALGHAATTPGTLAQRVRDHQVATGYAVPTRLRAIGPTSIILLTATVQDIQTSHGHRRHTENLAVTAVRDPDGTWSVADIEPATAGQQGEDPDADTP